MSTFLRFSRPFSDQGKCATGTTKKELLESAIPAKALYLDINISNALIGLDYGDLLPSGKGCNNTKSTTSAKACHVWLSGGSKVKVGDTEHQEGEIQREEEEEERDGRSKGEDEQEEGEDEPALEKSLARQLQTFCVSRAYHQVETERVQEWRWVVSCFESRDDFESTGCQDDGGADPETTV